MVKCECEDWTESIEKLNTAWVLLGPAMQYGGKEFVYCPWCGEKLQEVNYGNRQGPECTCGESTAGCPVHPPYEQWRT